MCGAMRCGALRWWAVLYYTYVPPYTRADVFHVNRYTAGKGTGVSRLLLGVWWVGLNLSLTRVLTWCGSGPGEG